MRNSQRPELIYIGDPMCSWCWGFAPVLDQILEKYGDQLSFRLIVGGLRPGQFAEVTDDRMKQFLREHWQHVHEASGQPFNLEFFERTDFLYDTEPPARALITMRQLSPSHEWRFFKFLQHAFYAENIDLKQQESCTPFLQQHKLEEKNFLKLLISEATQKATYVDFAASRNLGVTGFPTVLVKSNHDLHFLTRGYQPFERLEPALLTLLNA